MILKMNPDLNLSPTARIESQKPLKIEFKTVIYVLPLLFLSGVFTGIAIMLMATK